MTLTRLWPVLSLASEETGTACSNCIGASSLSVARGMMMNKILIGTVREDFECNEGLQPFLQ
jgi:hypothetical protein